MSWAWFFQRFVRNPSRMDTLFKLCCNLKTILALPNLVKTIKLNFSFSKCVYNVLFVCRKHLFMTNSQEEFSLLPRIRINSNYFVEFTLKTHFYFKHLLAAQLLQMLHSCCCSKLLEACTVLLILLIQTASLFPPSHIVPLNPVLQPLTNPHGDDLLFVWPQKDGQNLSFGNRYS